MQPVEHAGYDDHSVQLYTEMLFPKQLDPVPNHPIDQDMRASLIDTMMVSARATPYPGAIHLAVLIFDQYFGNFQPAEGEAYLQPQTVMDVALFIAVLVSYFELILSLLYPFLTFLCFFLSLASTSMVAQGWHRHSVSTTQMNLRWSWRYLVASIGVYLVQLQKCLLTSFFVSTTKLMIL